MRNFATQIDMSVEIKNKTAGYHWHILRLPIFVKNAFKKMKKHSSS